MKPKRPSRRSALRTLGSALAAGPLAVAGCRSSSSPTSPGGASGGCTVTASETVGPYPDNTGMLNTPAFYRQDVREGRPGTPLTLRLTIQNANSGCAALANAAVEIWQCDSDGHYSEYAQPGYNGSGQTFLRGLQTTDSSGLATFLTVYPGWYSGRATHIHVEIYVSGKSVKVTQVAFPEATTKAVYAAGAYASRGQNPTTNATDNVFSDGTSTELATVTGSTADGLTASLTIVVSA